jgi:hypothetical protein
MLVIFFSYMQRFYILDFCKLMPIFMNNNCFLAVYVTNHSSDIYKVNKLFMLKNLIL